MKKNYLLLAGLTLALTACHNETPASSDTEPASVSEQSVAQSSTVEEVSANLSESETPSAEVSAGSKENAQTEIGTVFQQDANRTTIADKGAFDALVERSSVIAKVKVVPERGIILEDIIKGTTTEDAISFLKNDLTEKRAYLVFLREKDGSVEYAGGSAENSTVSLHGDTHEIFSLLKRGQ